MTKQIMLGQTKMNPDFIELARWIDKTYDVKTINITYDTFIAARRKQSRLQICFEFERESLKFQDGFLGNFHADKQTAIAKKFRDILKASKSTNKWNLTNFSKSSPYVTTNILIVFSAFEPIARIEATQNVPEEKVEELQKELDNAELWKISRAFGGTTFFLYSDDQVKKYENSQARKDWTDRYFDLLDQYNEFDYLTRENFSIHLDSKENFDKNYESNWYYYYK